MKWDVTAMTPAGDMVFDGIVEAPTRAAAMHRVIDECVEDGKDVNHVLADEVEK